MTHSFVYACPLCHPAFEAFRLYATRRPFYGQKGDDVDTFGKGLTTAQVTQLKSADPNQRRAGLQGLIQHWVGQRLDMMRLSDDERGDIAAKLKKLKEDGTRVLKHFQSGKSGGHYADIYRDWESCPSCTGSAKAAFSSSSAP